LLVLGAPAVPSAWIVPAIEASPKTTITTGFAPAKFNVTPPAIVSPRNAIAARAGPPVWLMACAAGMVCPQTAPPQFVPSNVTVPAQLRLTGATGESDESCADVRLAGVYANVVEEHAAGIPGLTSTHWKPSNAPVPVQFDPQATSFRPAAATHLPLLQALSLVQ
jgi:hypothetical protein